MLYEKAGRDWSQTETGWLESVAAGLLRLSMLKVKKAVSVLEARRATAAELHQQSSHQNSLHVGEDEEAEEFCT